MKDIEKICLDTSFTLQILQNTKICIVSGILSAQKKRIQLRKSRIWKQR